MVNADGSVIIRAKVDVGQADKDLAKLKGSIEKTEREIEELSDEKEAAKQKSVFSAAELDAEKAKLQEMKKQLEEMREIAKDVTLSPSTREEAKAQIPGQREAISDQQTRVRLLQAEYNKIENSVSRYDERIAKATRKLERQQEEAGELAQKINSVSKASLKMNEAQEKAQKSMRKFSLRLREVLRSALIFTLITQSLAKFRDWMGNVLKTNKEAQQSFARLKGALLTAAQPLVDVLIPAATILADALTRILTSVAQITSALAGKTVEESKEAADALNKETEAIEGVGTAAEEASKSLAGFDEINKLSDNAEKNDSIVPDFDYGNGLSEESKGLATWIVAIGAGLATWKISKGVLDWFNLLAGGKFDNIGKVAGGVTSIATGITLLFSNVSAIKSGQYDNASALSAISSVVSGILVGLGLVLLGVAGWWALPVAAVISLVLTDLIVNAESYASITKSGLKTIRALFEGDSEGFWQNATDGLLTWLRTDSWAQKLGKAVFGEDVWKKAEKYFETDTIKDRFGPYFTSLVDFLETAWGEEDIGLIEKVGLTAIGMGSAFDLGLADGFAAVKQWIEDKVGFPIIDYLESSFAEKWSSFWGGIGDTVKQKLVDAINAALSWVNSGISKINAVLGTDIDTIPMISIPSLAVGQVAPKNMTFETALGNVLGLPGPAYRQQPLFGSNASQGSIAENVVILELDGREFGRAVYNANLNETNRYGVSMVSRVGG